MGSCQTQVQVQNLFYDNCWEIRFMLSTQGVSRAVLFFQPTVGAWNFFWTVDLCRILFLPMCTSRVYSVFIFFFKITQPLTPPPLRRLRNGRPHRPWKACVLFSTSHISFVTQYMLHVSVTGNIFRSGACSLHKELCHLCRINANG